MMSVQMTLIHVYLPLSSSAGMTISYFCHEVKRGGGGGPRLNVIMTLTLFGSVPLQKLKMEEWVVTSLDHFLTVDYRVLCDDQSSLAFIYGQVFNDYSSQGI